MYLCRHMQGRCEVFFHTPSYSVMKQERKHAVTLCGLCQFCAGTGAGHASRTTATPQGILEVAFKVALEVKKSGKTQSEDIMEDVFAAALESHRAIVSDHPSL
eukprot:TRINITY_DN1935_c0_g2_i1.p1 TRINITY_DN1935_c0_g2~~TRINITY_DN1935_c0_g2_i1.p1  ORF type:complete len:103 (+),score=12.39 TRINITY_DN1935_c0_g2_i1:467-775(+)